MSREFRLVESIAFEMRTSDAQLMESLGRYLVQKLCNPVTGDQEDDRGRITEVRFLGFQEENDGS